MSKLISDYAQYEVTNHAHSILFALFIGDGKFYPYFRNHNFSERFYQNIKCIINTIIYYAGDPAYTWILVLIYVLLIFNHTYATGINGITINNVTGYTVDIIPLLKFHFWKTGILQG